MKRKKKTWTCDEVLRRLKRNKPLVFTPNELNRPAGEDARPDKPPFVIRRHQWEQDLSHIDFDHKCGKAGGGISQHNLTPGQQESTIAKWYETEKGHVRLAYEIELLKEEFPQMQVRRSKDGHIVVYGMLGPNNLLSTAYHAEAIFPDDYCDRNRISVYVPKEHFPPGTPHLLAGNELSLAHWKWTCRDTMCNALAWATLWLAHYEHFRRTGKNLWG